MKFFWWLILALVALILILFAVSNREAVSVELWPLPWALDWPLYVVVLGTLVIGFFAGQFVTWVGGWRWRREARRSRERIARLERELEAARAETRSPVAALPR
ncbi:MAG TPA: LapA family protein [Stellaceae bacterium]|nr:LapA family protein [Stellaceae bacterium]